LAQLLALTALACAVGGDRGGDVPEIRKALAGLPDVEVLDAEGWDSMNPVFGPIAIRADLRIGHSGRLIVCNLTLQSVTGGAEFILARVGDWAPNIREIGRMRYVAGCPDSVDVGPGAPFTKLVPFPVKSVADLVTNYDRLSAVIES